MSFLPFDFYERVVYINWNLPDDAERFAARFSFRYDRDRAGERGPVPADCLCSLPDLTYLYHLQRLPDGLQYGRKADRRSAEDDE